MRRYLPLLIGVSFTVLAGCSAMKGKSKPSSDEAQGPAEPTGDASVDKVVGDLKAAMLAGGVEEDVVGRVTRNAAADARAALAGAALADPEASPVYKALGSGALRGVAESSDDQGFRLNVGTIVAQSFAKSGEAGLESEQEQGLWQGTFSALDLVQADHPETLFQTIVPAVLSVMTSVDSLVPLIAGAGSAIGTAPEGFRAATFQTLAHAVLQAPPGDLPAVERYVTLVGPLVAAVSASGVDPKDGTDATMTEFAEVTKSLSGADQLDFLSRAGPSASNALGSSVGDEAQLAAALNVLSGRIVAGAAVPFESDPEGYAAFVEASVPAMIMGLDGTPAATFDVKALGSGVADSAVAAVPAAVTEKSPNLAQNVSAKAAQSAQTVATNAARQNNPAPAGTYSGVTIDNVCSSSLGNPNSAFSDPSCVTYCTTCNTNSDNAADQLNQASLLLSAHSATWDAAAVLAACVPGGGAVPGIVGNISCASTFASNAATISSCAASNCLSDGNGGVNVANSLNQAATALCTAYSCISAALPAKCSPLGAAAAAVCDLGPLLAQAILCGDYSTGGLMGAKAACKQAIVNAQPYVPAPCSAYITVAACDASGAPRSFYDVATSCTSAVTNPNRNPRIPQNQQGTCGGDCVRNTIANQSACRQVVTPPPTSTTTSTGTSTDPGTSTGTSTGTTTGTTTATGTGTSTDPGTSTATTCGLGLNAVSTTTCTSTSTDVGIGSGGTGG